MERGVNREALTLQWKKHVLNIRHYVEFLEGDEVAGRKLSDHCGNKRGYQSLKSWRKNSVESKGSKPGIHKSREPGTHRQCKSKN